MRVRCTAEEEEEKTQTQQLEMKKNIWFHIRRYILGMDMGQPQPASYRTLLLDTIFSLFFLLLSLALSFFPDQIRTYDIAMSWYSSC